MATALGMTLEQYQESKREMFRLRDLNIARFGVGQEQSGFRSIEEAAGAGRDAIDNLREHVASINGYAAHLDPRNLKQLADLFGQEWANDYRARLEGSRAGAIDLLGVKQQQIAERFTVVGSLTLRDPDGAYQLGPFALETRVGGGTARLGSDGRLLAGPGAPSPPATTVAATAATAPAPTGPIDLRA